MATFDVELTGGAPWGFSMVGGSDFNQPLNISKVINIILRIIRFGTNSKKVTKSDFTRTAREPAR